MAYLFGLFGSLLWSLFLSVPLALADESGSSFSDSILDAFSAGFFATLGSAVLAAFNWLLDGLILVIGYTLFSLFDGLLTCLSGVLSGIGLAGMLGGMVANMAGLPDGMIWMLNQVGFFPGITLILGAIITRKCLDVIPLPWQF